MKKFNVGLASLVLFFVTGAAISMEKKNELYVRNNLIGILTYNNPLTGTPTWNYPQRLKMTAKSSYYFANEAIVVNSGKTQAVDDVSNVSTIEIEQIPKTKIDRYFIAGYMATSAVKGKTQQGAMELTKKAAKEYLGLHYVDITNQFADFLKSPNYKGKDVVINFNWLYPNSYVLDYVEISIENKE